MLSDEPGKKLNKYVPNYVVFDLETTGVSCAYDEVVEISAVKVVNGEVVDEFSTLVNPGRHIPAMATDVNGITDDMVKDAPCFRDALSDFLAFVDDFVLVGHNINSFDMKFLYRDADRFFKKTIDNDFVDTLPLARACLPELGHHRLTDLAVFFKISTKGAHRALNDCRMNQQVFERLGEQMKSNKKLAGCPKCGSLMVKRVGKFGEFFGCTGYPNCKYTKNIYSI